MQSCVEELKVVSEMKRDQEELQPLKSAPAAADEERGCRRKPVLHTSEWSKHSGVCRNDRKVINNP